MSKIESGKMILNIEQISLKDIMQGIVNIMQPQIREKQQYFNVYIQDISVENVCGDSLRLNQIFSTISRAVSPSTAQSARTPRDFKEVTALSQTISSSSIIRRFQLGRTMFPSLSMARSISRVM